MGNEFGEILRALRKQHDYKQVEVTELLRLLTAPPLKLLPRRGRNKSRSLFTTLAMTRLNCASLRINSLPSSDFRFSRPRATGTAHTTLPSILILNAIATEYALS